MKFLKIFFINILLSLLVFFVFEFVIYFAEVVKTRQNFAYILFRQNYTETIIKNLDNICRKPYGLHYNKKPILIYGCSYANGWQLKEYENIGYLLSKKTKRPVYNFATPSGCLQHVLYLMQNQNPISPEPEYVFYFYIQDHIRRLYMSCSMSDTFKYFSYKNQKGTLHENKFVYYLKNTITYQYIVRCFIFHKIPDEEIFNTIKLYLQEMKKNINKNYPQAKFIYVIYDKQNDLFFHFNREHLQEIRNLGIEVLDLDDYFGDLLYKVEYQLNENDPHPNAKAWELISDKIIELEKL